MLLCAFVRIGLLCLMIILRKIRRWSSLTVNFDSLVLLAPLYDR